MKTTIMLDSLLARVADFWDDQCHYVAWFEFAPRSEWERWNEPFDAYNRWQVERMQKNPHLGDPDYLDEFRDEDDDVAPKWLPWHERPWFWLNELLADFYEAKRRNQAHFYLKVLVAALFDFPLHALPCALLGHRLVDNDPGNAEVGPQPNVECMRCGRHF